MSTDSFISKVLEGDFEDAIIFCNQERKERICEILMSIVYDVNNLCIYGFIDYLYKRDGDTIWLDFLTTIMFSEFCFIEGGYSLGLFYARQLVEKERSVKNLCILLDSWDDGHVIFEEEEAISIAKEILSIEPQNSKVKKYFPDLVK